MKEKTIVSAFALIGSLTAYYYAKNHDKDPTPLLMLGGFVGAFVGEVISQVGSKDIPTNSSSNNKSNLKEIE